MVERLKQLLAANAPSGHEDAAAAVLTRLSAPYGAVTRDAMGNLIVRRGTGGKRVALLAHMDTVGLVATYIEPEGFVRFGALGGLQPAALLAQKVRFECGAVAVVRAEAGVKASELTMDNLYLDPLGAKIEIGETAVFSGSVDLSGELISAPGLDDRIGCAILLEVLRTAELRETELICIFTVQEELGLRGAGPAAFGTAPELAVIVDVCGAGGLPGDEERNPVRVGAGPVLKLMDAASVSHPKVEALLTGAAEAENIPIQRAAPHLGGTDAGGVQKALGGIPTGQLAIATRGIHTPGEVASLSDAAQCAQLLTAMLRRL